MTVEIWEGVEAHFWVGFKVSGGDSVSWGSVKVLEGLKLILGVFEVLGGSKVLGVQDFEGC